jgi:uncharacterized protein (TIGR01319 family)
MANGGRAIGELPETILITDIGSTTTKALLFERSGVAYTLLGRAEAPTTVEAPTEDVCVGLLNAARALGERLGRKLTDNGRLAAGSGFDTYLSTSSAGGGLQILVSGLAKTVTAKSAFRAACAAGGVLLDVLAIDDGRKPHEKVEAIEDLRPDMILIAGGIDGGEVANVVRMASVILAANLKPKYLPEGRMPVVYAGNVDARGQMEAMLRGKVELMIVDNLRPEMDRENLGPTRRAIHELFTRHVMARAPGYSEVSGWTKLPIEPTPVAVESMLEIISRRQGRNVIMVDIGGATTDIFSFFDGSYNRTVSANLGMSYSASNVLLEAGAGNIMRWLSANLSERKLRNMIANKCIHPTRLPRDEVELEVEQACAREALRLALKTHRELSVRVRTTTTKDWTRATFWSGKQFKPEFAEEQYIQMGEVALLFGSGGVLSHAPERWQAALMLIDSLGPVGITELGVDSIFMMPHLGALARLSVEAAYKAFLADCFVPLGTCISFAGRIAPGQHAATVKLSGHRSEEIAIAGGELRVIPAAANEEFDVKIVPARKVDAGAGPGKPVTGVCRGGKVGIIIDARGRPIQFPEDPSERRTLVNSWRRSFTEAKR